MQHAVLKHLDISHTLTVCLYQQIFLAKHDHFRIGKFCVWHKIMFIRRNVPCHTAIAVPVVRIHTASSWSPHYMDWEYSSILPFLIRAIIRTIKVSNLHFDITGSRHTEVNFVTSRYWHNHYYIYYFTALFLTKSHVPGAITSCGWRQKQFCKVICWRATQVQTHSRVYSIMRSKYTCI